MLVRVWLPKAPCGVVRTFVWSGIRGDRVGHYLSSFLGHCNTAINKNTNYYAFG
jgi:hypothetical protein